ncbi:MAG: adenine phosphoribosyltransferase, partial [Clostridia bacterium]|nr:adenine phosphoribosyltransferase [Clostridia bacterium]
MIMEYKMKIAGLERALPLCPLNDKMYIAGFVMFGDIELTEACAKALIKAAPEHDVMITAESKGIPLVCAMARQMGVNKYILARKSPKLYMRNVVKFDVQSITTRGMQALYLDGKDVEYIKGKRVLIVDDVISTGASLAALEHLVEASGGKVVGRMAVLAEGEAAERHDIIYLEKLPL